MSTHETNIKRLALAAAGALSREELLEVEQHARECESCRRELEFWGMYTRGLQQLPQPSLPASLVARTQAKVLNARAEAASRRRSQWMFGGLAVLSWGTNFVVWAAVRALTGGVFEVMGANLVSPGPWFLLSSILAGTTAAVAAAMLRRDREGRLS